jgi:hypothetical protein
MEWLKAIESIASQWWIYVTWCMEADIRAPICRPFWTWVLIGCAASGFLGLVWIVVKIVSYRIKLAAAIRAEEARNAADGPEIIRQQVWQGDNANRDNATAQELELRIKAGLDKLKHQ